MKKQKRRSGDLMVRFVLSMAVALMAAHAAAQQSQPVIYLNQAWSQADREWYYQFSQGSTVISYDVFLNLEVAGSEELFRSNANSERFGLITQAPSAMNPDGLPIGLAKGTLKKAYIKGEIPGEYVGLTCAACHDSELYYQGKRIRIDGGISTIDLAAYIYALDDALQATLADPAKFDRLAARLKVSGDAKAALRKRVEGNAARVHEYRTRTLVTLTDWGPHRMDAIALIINRLTNILPAIPENWSTPLAPTKPPFLWNAPQGLWTQWRGVQQVPIDRNLVETMGVFMSIDLQSKGPKEGLFDSNAAIENLGKVENLLARLAPPSWPEDVFGKIDREKARQGKGLFVALCSGCHNVWPYNWTEPNKYGKRFVLVGLTPQSYVGTDPNQFETARPYASWRLTCPGRSRTSRWWIPERCISARNARCSNRRSQNSSSPMPNSWTSWAIECCLRRVRRKESTRPRRGMVCGRRRRSCTTARCPTCMRCWFPPRRGRRNSAMDASSIQSRSVSTRVARRARSSSTPRFAATRTPATPSRTHRAATA